MKLVLESVQALQSKYVTCQEFCSKTQADLPVIFLCDEIPQKGTKLWKRMIRQWNYSMINPANMH